MQDIEKISPKIDVVFKALFAKKGNEDLLEDLIESIIERKVKCKEVIKEARIGGRRPEEKYGALDIRVELETGEEIDIEIQLVDKKHTINRALYYMSLLTTEDLNPSQTYAEMKQKIVIFILDYKLFNYEEIVNESRICLEKHIEKEITKLHKYYFVELPNVEGITNKDMRRLKLWIAFLNQNKGELNMVKEDKIIKKAQEEYEYLTEDAEVKRLAWLREKAIRDELTMKEIGKEEGKQEGIKHVAKSLLDKAVSIDLIISCTGLSKEEIEELK